MRRENGLPAGPIEKWLRGGGILIASLKQGGIYLSRDEGVNWARLDEDAERGRAAGLAEIGAGNCDSGVTKGRGAPIGTGAGEVVGASEHAMGKTEQVRANTPESNRNCSISVHYCE